MRALVVEDDQKIASFIRKGLQENSFAVDHASDGESGLVLTQTVDYDVMILDLMLPKLDGLSFLKTVRAENTSVPIIILSAKNSVQDRVNGLQLGADDYLTKPFAFSELLARVQALLRRRTQAEEPTKISVGDLKIDLLTRQVTRGENEYELQPREFSLLEFLARNSGRVITKTMILEHVWDYAFDPQTNVVDVLVSRLRNKIDKEKTLIHTIRGVGYVLK